MPPRGTRKAVRRAAPRATRPTRVRAKTSRGLSRRTSKYEIKAIEEKPLEVEEKPKPESWLDKLPPVIKPDEELHQRLLKERHEKHSKKVYQYCSLESKGILEFILKSISLKNDPTIDDEEVLGRKMRQLHSDFREGLFTPELDSNEESIEPSSCSTKLEPKFSLEVQNYLRFTSDSMWKDLSTFFNCELNETVVHDPDPKFNEFLEYLQNNMKLFQQPYHPFDKIKFPFNICIIGPAGTGRTTVTQLLQKVFDVNIVEVVPQPPTELSGSLKRKKSSNIIEQIQEMVITPEYPLKDSTTIKIIDDKSTIASIAQFVVENQSKGTIIMGYPNTKSQLVMLEKAITQHNQSTLLAKSNSESVAPPRSPNSQSQNQNSSKSKTQVFNIHGLIFTVNPNNSREKLIDPITGNVYKEDFLMPSFLDFYDVLPTEFLKKRDEIVNRFVTVTVPEIPPLTNKNISSLNTFESGCRKNYVTAVIPHCDSIDTMLHQIDLFIDALFKKNDKPIIETPLQHLAHPYQLVKPGLCYNAILSWRECLDLFAPSIADQSNLVGIIGNRLDRMTDDAFDRFALYTFTSDKRSSLCNEFQRKESSIPPSFPSSNPQNTQNPLLFLNSSSSLSQNPHFSLTLPSHSPLQNNPFTSRFSLPHSLISPNANQLKINTARSPPLPNQSTNSSKPSRAPPLQTKNDSDSPPQRPQTAKALKVTKSNKVSDTIKKRPQTQQSHITNSFKTRMKSRLGNSESDSNEEAYELEMKQKEESRNREFSDFFKIIWDLSLKSRDQNLKYVQQIVEKSGLLELVVELRKTPKLIFISLILRLYYTRWFYENFYELYTKDDKKEALCEEEETNHHSSFLDEFKIDRIHPPKFDVQSKSLKYNESSTQQSFSLKEITPNFIEGKAGKSLSHGKSSSDLYVIDENIDSELKQNNDIEDENNPNNIIEDFLKKKKNENNQKLSNKEIYFNQDKATIDFNIPQFQSNVTFDDTLKFVDKFFNHYIRYLDDQFLKSNVKSSLILFNTFSKSVKNKEIVLSEAIKNLNHLVSDYAYTKCSHEMEKFSEKFRNLRKNGVIEGKLFEYDYSGFRKENLHLANFSINYSNPIIIQSIVSFKSIKKIGEALAGRNQKFCNIRTFMFILHSINGINEIEAAAIELCVKILACSECFSIKKLLLLFVHFPEEEEIIYKMFPDNLL